jgi:hypothetical protein
MKTGEPMSATAEHDLSGELRASDADRDAVVSELGEHFQAGRLTVDELDDRTGRALTARTWGELRELLADLPATGTAPRIPAARTAGPQPMRSPGQVAPPAKAGLAGLVIAALVLVVALHAGWGLLWLLVPAMIIARKVIRATGPAQHYGQGD